ncbi:retrieval of early ER protein Rer1 [Paraphysoderma sedebokerense]|nr:retrieval of early ER protein Rer1 [Paraphysoderma sedebokerense]
MVAASLDSPPANNPVDNVRNQVTALERQFQSFLDSTTPYIPHRWGCTFILFILYIIRVTFIQGFYIVTYALGIYLLNIFLLFLSPKFDPAMENDDELDNESGGNEGPSLPLKRDEEFKPFIRRLPEFKFWLNATRAFLIALFCTFFSIFDVPVFWPVLVFYFIVLFSLTMRRQIKHMIKYRYVPWDWGKRRYSTGGGKK